MLEHLDQAVLREQLKRLRVEHRALDDEVRAQHHRAAMDALELQRLKKKKLQLKDAIAKLESLLIPDLEA